MSMVIEFNAAASGHAQDPAKPKRLNPEALRIIQHTLLDTDEYRSRLGALTPAMQFKRALADLNEYRTVQSISVSGVDIPSGRRPIREEAVAVLMESMRTTGLRTPIAVRYYAVRPEFLPPEGEACSDAHVLWTGRHRLEAARRLGWEQIEAFVYHFGDETDARLWEIAENLHRAELSALERDEQVAEWVQLSATKAGRAREQGEGVSAQVAPKPAGGRPESGVRSAARELGLDRDDTRRAVKVAGLSEEAKQAARDAGLDDNRSALLDAAKHSAPEDQVASLAARKARRGTQRPEPERPEALEDEERQLSQSAPPDPAAEYRALLVRLDALGAVKPDIIIKGCPPRERAALCSRLAPLLDAFGTIVEAIEP